MSTKVVAAVVLVVLFSLGLAFQGAPSQTILICAISIILGSILPDADRVLYPFWKWLRMGILLMGAFLVAYTFLMAPVLCFYVNFGGCEFLLPIIVAALLAFLFLFDYVNPAKPPFHSLIALVFSAVIYSILLTYLGFSEVAVIAAAAFGAGYALHYALESANVDRSRI